MRDDIPMPDCIKFLARARRNHPQPDIITTLIGQCKNYGSYLDMGPAILRTIDALQHAEHRGGNDG